MHTLKYCENWSAQRAQLQGSLGLDADFTLMDVVGVMVTEEKWLAFSTFSEEIMNKKEEEERRRERERESSLRLPILR